MASKEPDVVFLDVFLWETLKNEVYKTCLAYLEELEVRIMEEIANILEKKPKTCFPQPFTSRYHL